MNDVPQSSTRLPRSLIEARLKVCNPLPSLTCTNHSLSTLLSAEQGYTTQISDVIRNDPSLTTRILQLVNSVYFGLSNQVKGIDEAVFYLGLDQIRQLALITPVIDDFRTMVGEVQFNWRGFWLHSIGTAILTREVLRQSRNEMDETVYLAGLIHDVGKIVMASVFPDQFRDIRECVSSAVQDLEEVERFILGIGHSELGALYLKYHNVPDIFVESARLHHTPPIEHDHAPVIAAVQVADMLVRHAKIGASGSVVEVEKEDLFQSAGWNILFPEQDEEEDEQAFTELSIGMKRLPAVLEAMV